MHLEENREINLENSFPNILSEWLESILEYLQGGGISCNEQLQIQSWYTVINVPILAENHNGYILYNFSKWNPM